MNDQPGIKPRIHGSGPATPAELDWAQAPGEMIMGVDVVKVDRAGHRRSRAEAEALVRARLLLIAGESAPVLVIASDGEHYRVRRADGNLMKLNPIE
jgi:hypothetical protein